MTACASMRLWFTALFAIAGSFAVRAEDALDLSARVQPGQRWVATNDASIRIQTTDGPLGPMSTPGLMQSTQKYTATVIEASGGQWTKLELAYDKCELRAQAPGANRVGTTKDPLSSRRVTLTRTIDRETHEQRIEIDAPGAALPAEAEDNLKLTFGDELMPRTPVRPGSAWQSDKVGMLFGADAQGKMDFRLARIETTPAGRHRGILDIAGTTHHEVAGRQAEGFQVSTDLAVDYEYRGTAAVDLATGLIEAIDLQGAVEMNHGGASGQGFKQHGKYQLQIRATPMEPVARVIEPPPPNQIAPANPVAQNANPLASAVDFAGTYRNDELTVTMTQQKGEYTGVITLGDKKFPLRAKAQGASLGGAFESAGNAFPFSATLDGPTLKFSTGGKDRTLKRDQTAANPLAANAPENPLAK